MQRASPHFTLSWSVNLLLKCEVGENPYYGCVDVNVVHIDF